MLNIKYLDLMIRRALFCLVLMFSIGGVSFGLASGASRKEFVFETNSGWKGVTASTRTSTNETYQINKSK